jgi:hypothetical protein
MSYATTADEVEVPNGFHANFLWCQKAMKYEPPLNSNAIGNISQSMVPIGWILQWLKSQIRAIPRLKRPSLPFFPEKIASKFISIQFNEIKVPTEAKQSQ